METRLIEPRDAESLRTLRIRAVKEYPTAFAASVEEETALSIDEVANQLSDGHSYSFWWGAFDNSMLIGILHLFRYQRPKVNHKTMLGGMYVIPEFQKHGIGRMLLEDIISFAKTLDGVEMVTLAVTVGNNTARKLYLSAGFDPFGTEPRYIRIDTTYYDIEWMILNLQKQK
jgi:RimJ/RimL family protein N-acetyltransferase